jgi:hypothetical protein
MELIGLIELERGLKAKELMANSSWLTENGFNPGLYSKNPQFPFRNSHSAFHLPHSAFRIPNSPFPFYFLDRIQDKE